MPYSTGVNKYNNQKTKVDGIEFDSRHEARRYCELKLMLRAGVIRDLRLQVKYHLIPAQYIDGKCVERACDYIADFVYYDVEKGCEVTEDAKGKRTKEYIIKRKLMLKVYGIRVREV